MHISTLSKFALIGLASLLEYSSGLPQGSGSLDFSLRQHHAINPASQEYDQVDAQIIPNNKGSAASIDPANGATMGALDIRTIPDSEGLAELAIWNPLGPRAVKPAKKSSSTSPNSRLPSTGNTASDSSLPCCENSPSVANSPRRSSLAARAVKPSKKSSSTSPNSRLSSAGNTASGSSLPCCEDSPTTPSSPQLEKRVVCANCRDTGEVKEKCGECENGYKQEPCDDCKGDYDQTAIGKGKCKMCKNGVQSGPRCTNGCDSHGKVKVTCRACSFGNTGGS